MRFRKRKLRRPVFGFPCDPSISELIRDLSQQLALPIYPVAEHCAALGAEQVVADLEEEDTRRLCLDHIASEHFLNPAFDVENQYDLEAAAKIQKRQLYDRKLENMTRKLLQMLQREGIPASALARIATALVQDVRRRRYHDS